MIAGAGFDGQAVRDGDVVPPVRRGGHLLDAERKARADLVAQARLDGWFGQGWKAETVNLVIRRKFGDTIRSRKRSLQRRGRCSKDWSTTFIAKYVSHSEWNGLVLN